MPKPSSASFKRLRSLMLSTTGLALHPWDEPLKTAAAMAGHEPPTVLRPVIGEVVEL